ncbi:MAG: histidine kinase [Acidimicrobiales bacterium]
MASDGSALPGRRTVAVFLAATVMVAVGWLSLRATTSSDLAPRRDSGVTAEGLIVEPTSRDSPLRRGDLIVAVEDIPVSEVLAGTVTLEHKSSYTYRVLRQGRSLPVQVTLADGLPLWSRFRDYLTVIVVVVLLVPLAVFVLARAGDQPAAAAFGIFAAALLGAVVFAVAGWEVHHAVAGRTIFWVGIAGQGFFSLLTPSLAHFAFTFPEPAPMLRRWRWSVWVLYAVPLSVFVGVVGWIALAGAETERYATIDAIVGVLGMVVLLVALVGVVASVRRARRSPAGARRVQLIGLGAGSTIAAALAVNVVPNPVSGSAAQWLDVLAGVAFVPLPLAVAVAIARREFADIDPVLNRTLVWITVSVALLSLYLLMVAITVPVLGDSDVAPGLPAAAIVALTLSPLRARVQSAVNRRFYGERANHHAVATRLVDASQHATPGEALDVVVETIITALRLPHVAITADESTDVVLSERGRSAGPSLAVALMHQGERVGTLVASPRPGEQKLSPKDVEVLTSLAPTVAAVVAANHSITQLVETRDRLAVIGAQERTRVQHDLHDRIGPELFGLVLALDAEAERDTHPTERAVFLQLRDRAEMALADVRALARGLTTPTLEETGLVPALRAASTRLAAGSHGIVIDVRAPLYLPKLDREVTEAAFFVCVEAMSNAVHHSRGTVCRVVLAVSAEPHELVLEVADNGVGICDDAIIGVGVTSMRSRVEQLGGCFTLGADDPTGTVVFAAIPLSHQP